MLGRRQQAMRRQRVERAERADDEAGVVDLREPVRDGIAGLASERGLVRRGERRAAQDKQQRRERCAPHGEPYFFAGFARVTTGLRRGCARASAWRTEALTKVSFIVSSRPRGEQAVIVRQGPSAAFR